MASIKTLSEEEFQDIVDHFWDEEEENIIPQEDFDTDSDHSAYDSHHCSDSEQDIDESMESENMESQGEMRDNFERSRDANDVNVDEMRAFIGLLLLSDVLKSAHLNFEELWADSTGCEIFPLTMSSKDSYFCYAVKVW
ncbi:hypothetical protein ABEB36_014964 [Hypothenemus hampei]|uniref:PiggyBac transposable element-derived protein domain-containing protein n=1 Tax=Hypothenemus hampei TaxID=57062 RepID=A0ABD1E1E2_HYPHA